SHPPKCGPATSHRSRLPSDVRMNAPFLVPTRTRTLLIVTLDQLVQTSRQVAAAPGRLAKIDRLAALLQQARPEEIALVILYLSGATRQSRLGVGWATLEKARTTSALEPTLEIAQVDASLESLARLSGKGSSTTRAALLADLFRRATAEEQDFLLRLLTGEIRQGALEGIMVEAVAKAAQLPAGDVRRAAMLSGELAPVAVAALSEGAAGLTR